MRRNHVRSLGAALLAAGLLTAGPAVTTAAAETEPGTGVPQYVQVDANAQPSITSVTTVSDRILLLQVASPAMRREVPVNVLLPADRSEPRGVLYLLDGNSGQVESTNWLDPTKGDAQAFFADKNVNIVMPVGGTGSLYQDWTEDHPKFGRTQWETFLSKELPPLIDARFDTSGRNVIGGISSGAQGAVMLAARNPELYDGAVGYSGCYMTEGPVGPILTDLIVMNGMATSDMMWGPQGSDAWRDHDLFRNASRLAGKKVYLSSGNGLPGPHESLDQPDIANTVVVGGLLEAGSNACTDQLAQALRSAGADVTRSAQPTGVHAWIYWRDELGRSWPTIEAALHQSTESNN
ncbi:alpha/beta hydrolase [Prescottella agglutinans]|uniref:Diacylglycerol O-acyltransferase/trehalose O-mycolyltransferase n=1 Tax=Prescottella agglutinans TaxID=1644129 RepID=A0ABT6MGQ0_9NOCA|nr:alpha/beta hydrolase family protein [Prescottella agglutinans]MDH6283498.1 diacylglycerol O-acyltransferase/trehalose O-mycolyltransferase [Prescottella agglutinans]